MAVDPSQIRGWFGPVVPGATAGSGAQRAGTFGKKEISIPLAYVGAAGTAGSATVIARVVNPSRRMAVGIALVFRPTTRKAVANYDSDSIISIRALDPATDTPLHLIKDSQAAPYLYEGETVVPGFLVTCGMGVPIDAAAARVDGVWELLVTWEPNMPFCPEEAAVMYNGASAGVVLPTSVMIGP